MCIDIHFRLDPRKSVPSPQAIVKARRSTLGLYGLSSAGGHRRGPEDSPILTS